jgi:hypothetical protein
MTTPGLGLSIAVLAFGASTIYLAVKLSDERELSSQLASETRALNERIAELEKLRAEPRPMVSGVFGAVNVPPGAMVSASPPVPVGKSESKPARLEAVVVNNSGPSPMGGEAFRKMMRSQMRAHNRQMYADVGKQLGLSKEDAGKLIDLITDQQTAGFTISRDTTDPSEGVRQMNEARREYDTKIAEFLGPEKAQLFEQYQQTIPLRQEVDMLAHQIAGSDAGPLNEDQRKRLLAALVEEHKQYPAPDYRQLSSGEDYKTSWLNWQDDHNARIAAEVRGILDSEQYAAYTEYQNLQKEMNEQAHRAGPTGNVFFSTAAPAVMAGDAIMVTAPEEVPAKKP